MKLPGDRNGKIYRNEVSANRRGDNFVSLRKLKDEISMDSYGDLHARILPRKLVIDTTNVCNANCVFCAYQYRKEAPSFMSQELFDRASKDYASFHPESFLTLTPALGEPLLDPELFLKIKSAKANGIKRVQFYTNGILLKKRLKELLDSPPDNLEISLADFDREEYFRIYRVNRYDEVLSGISSLLRVLKEEKRKLPVKINLMGRRSWEEIAASTDFKNHIEPFLSDYVFIDLNHEYDNWNGSIKSEDLLSGMRIKLRDRGNRLPCRRSHDLQLLPDGTIRLCGARRLPEGQKDGLVVGNINEDSFAKIWDSEKTKSVISSFFTNDVPEVCQNCSYYEASGTVPNRTVYLRA